MKRFSGGALYCTKFSNFSTKSRAEMSYHIAKKHSKATARFGYKCKVCDKDIHSFYNLQEHKRKEHGAQRGSGVQNIDVAHVIGDVDDNSLKEVYNIAMDTLDPKNLLEKLDVVFDISHCAAKLNVAFDFVLKKLRREELLVLLCSRK